MKIEGSLMIPLTISSFSFNQKIAVEDIGINEILGLYFMTDNKCLIDVNNAYIFR